MQATFLGGAEEIGASCAVLDLDGKRLLVDCGQRLGVAPGEALPDFSLLEDGPPIDAVLLTHAHTDHIGALPAAEPFLGPDCLIHGTQATLELAKVMLGDSQRIMSRYRRGEGEFPLFPSAAVHATFARFCATRWGKTIRIGHAGPRVTWLPAGHILGAAMVQITGSKETALFTGDVSVADQLSVPGLYSPAGTLDLLVLECTYGNRYHAHRPAQEARLVQRVAQCIAEGGSVLFPSFALGRAQEVLLLMGRAMRQGNLPQVPIYADGLVRAISAAYSQHAEDLSLGCRQLLEAGLDPIFPDDLPIRPIRNQRHREEIARGEPCVVVTSSGMLQGGPSQFFAYRWLGSERNLVLITGYQDEESPGQALLNLIGDPGSGARYIELGGTRVQVRCQAECGMLSAHADAGELVALASKLRPRLTLAVHGDHNSRQALARSLMAGGCAQVMLPTTGQTCNLPPKRVRFHGPATAVRPTPLAHWPPWDPLTPRSLDLARFHEWLTSLEPPVERLSIDELAEIWKSPEEIGAEDWALLRRAVYDESQRFFEPDAKRPYLLRVTPRGNLATLAAGPLLSVENAAPIVREYFPPESGLLHFAFDPEQRILLMEFRYHQVAQRRYGRRRAELSRRIGWQTQLNGSTRNEDLLSLAQSWLPTSSFSEVDICHDSCQMRVTVATTGSTSDLDMIVERFRRRTGYDLCLLRRDETS